MFKLDPIVLGLVLFTIGLASILVVPVLLRALSHLRPIVQSDPNTPAIQVSISQHEDAVLLVRPGGRVIYANPRARALFGMEADEQPNLERLARSTRPGEAFLSLCVTEGQARFNVQKTMVEGTSFVIPHEEGQIMLVSLRRPQLAGLESDTSQPSGQALTIFTELSQSMSSSLDLEITLRSVLESVGRLVQSDLAEIDLWNEDRQTLTPYRFVADSGTDYHVERTTERPLADSGYSRYLISTHQHLLVQNVETQHEAMPGVDKERYPFRSYLGLPLLIAGELVGTLELAALEPEAFDESDLQILRVISGQAAVALHNAIVHRQEQERANELAGLAQLAQVGGSLQDPQELFQRLVETIAPLLDVEILGFLIYDETHRMLRGQVPFQGMPPQFVELYQTEVPFSGPAFKLWSDQEVIRANDHEDQNLQALGLSHLTQAAGIRNTALIPLTSGGRMLGYMQVANKPDNSVIDEADLRFMKIIAGQAAPIIENAALVKETRQRTQRAEALRRVASLAGSSATLDEILKFSLQELVSFLQADSAGIMLLDDTRGELRLHLDSLMGVPREVADRNGHIPINTPAYHRTVTESLHPLASGAVDIDEDLPEVYRPLLRCFADAMSMLSVPLVIRDRGVGEVILVSVQTDFFNRSDIQSVATAASQLASAIERSSLYSQTDETLQRRVDHLTSLTRISRELNTTLNLEHLLERVHAEMVRTTGAHSGSITMFEMDDHGRRMDNVMLSVGEIPDVELSSIEQQVLETGEPVVIEDFMISGFEPCHEGMRSAMIVPVAFQDDVAGLIHLHARGPERFDAVSLEITQSLAMQAAIALGNAQRYQDQVHRGEMLGRRVEALAKLFETAQTLHLEQPLVESLEAIAYGIQESTPFEVVLVYVYSPQSQLLYGESGAGLPLDRMDEIRGLTHEWETVESLTQPEYRVQHSYFIPGEELPDVPRLIPMSALFSYTTPPSTQRAWQLGDTLISPLVSAAGQPLGVIAVDAPRDGLRPDKITLETLEIFATEAVLVIESAQKVRELKGQVGHIQQEFVRAEEASRTAQGHLAVLLHKDLEQTIAIQRLHDRSRRIRIGLDIAEIVNRQPDRSAVLMALGHQMLTQMELDVALIAEPSSGGPRLVHNLGSMPPNAKPEALLGQRNPLRTSLQTGEIIFVPNMETTPEWESSPLLRNLDAKGFITIPISSNGTVEAALLAVSQTVISAFSKEDEQIYELIGNQVAIALQNLNLLTETRRRLREVNMLLDFSRQLGTLDPDQILSTLIESALRVMSNAHAGVVLLWDPEYGALVPSSATGYTNNEVIQQISYKSGEALPGQVFAQRSPRRVDEIDFANHYNLSSHNLLLYREGTGGRVPVSAMIIPIQTGDTALGVIILDNFNTPGAFSVEDEALITSLTQQTALTLENARLFQAADQRAAQLQALTEVSTTITSSLDSDALTATLLDQLADVIPFNTGTLWLRTEDQLTVKAARGFDDSEQRVGLTAAMEDSALLNAMIRSGQPLSIGNVNDDPRFPTLFKRQYHSWLGIPLISKGEVVGVIALEKEEINFYTFEHIQATTTFASQAAVALENARLFEESFQRAQELDRRSQRLAQLNLISTELSSSLDPEHVLVFTTKELFHAVRCSAVAAVLFDEEQVPSLRSEMPNTGIRIPQVLADSPAFEHIRQTHGVYSSANLANDPRIAPLQDLIAHYNAQSLLAVPIATANDLHGVFMIFIDENYHFTSEETELALTISNQAAVAVENAIFYRQAEQRAVELSTMLETARAASSTLELEEVLRLIAEQMVKAVNVDGCTLYRLDHDADAIVTWIEWRKAGLPDSEQVDQRYALDDLPIVRTVVETIEPHTALADDSKLDIIEQSIMQRKGVKSMLMLPLAVGERVIGLVELDEHQDERYFSGTDIRLAQALADQVAVAIERALLFEETRRFTEELEQRVAERTTEVQVEHQRARTLLQISNELSASLDLDHVINRSLELLNENTRAEQSSIILHRIDQPKLFYRAGIGILPQPPTGGRPTSFDPGEGLGGWVIANRRPVIIPDLAEDDRWVMMETETDVFRSALAVPLTVGEDALGVLLQYHRQPDHFSRDQVDLMQAAANQFAVAINNGELYRLIRDQAEDLGTMLRSQQVEASRSTAMLEGVADGVLVTDTAGTITLFNQSAEEILHMSSDQVVGKTLENFTGLFGAAAQTWMDAIRAWIDVDTSDHAGEDYAERITLEDGRVVSVHLAPVSSRGEFLGTVSIFRDITHQVEVDRLKSEFVATVSHELRTPMTPIKGYVEFLLMGGAGDLNDQQKQFLGIIKSNTDRLSILVNDLLDVSRIEAGKVAFSFQPVDMQEVIEDIVGDLLQQSQEEEKPMTIELVPAPDLPLVNGDMERIRQIVRNLVTNAYNYTSEGGRIVVRIFRENENVRIDVQDNGIGIFPEDQERVFDRFYRGENPLVMATAGTGLGLAIVRQLVEMHNGEIWVESSGVPGDGSTFSFTLPIYDPEKEIVEEG
ncbi:MAG: GAF domain-containing protein [Anaerolineales bacterium]|nr:GAF domain-containing protein [Anaerolineales bacterium]